MAVRDPAIAPVDTATEDLIAASADAPITRTATRHRMTRILVLGLSLAFVLALVGTGLLPARPVAAQTAPPPPPGWPGMLQMGMADAPGGAAAMKATAPYGFRYQYLAGGVNTNQGWSTWNANGQFVTYYIDDSVKNGIIPVFTYYMMYQSLPGNTMGEPEGVQANLENPATMTAYYNDVKLFFQRAGAFPGTMVVLHVEPDLWGYAQQRAVGDNAATVPAIVGSSGVPELAGLPDNVSGFARAIDKLRDTYAPNVVLGYHMSVWGTKIDIVYSNPPDREVDALATRAGSFFLSLQGGFDVAFAEFSDRDAAFKQYVYKDGGASWWDAADFRRHVRFLGMFVSVTRKRVVLWQIPLGNTKMRAMNNTWNHYQDNRVEWLLDDPGRAHLEEYRQAGVLAFLFGGGAGGTTCACDAAKDGVTNPEPINGNTGLSLSADDDGGFFKQKAREYYAVGPMALAGGSSTPPTTPISPVSCSPRPKVRVTATPAGAGTLRVSVTAGSGALQHVRFGPAVNGLIDAGGQTGLAGGFTLPVGASQTTFVVRRASPGSATTVPFVAVDACGEWSSFVGGGPGAF